MSRQLDSLLKGLSIFKEGVTSFATARAINNAHKELDAAKIAFGAREGMTPEQLELEEERMSEMRNTLAQRLSGELAAIGAPATTIQAATSFGLTRPQELTLESQRATQSAKDARTTAVANIKQKSDVGKSIRDVVENFNKDKVVGAARESIIGSEKIVDLFDQFPARKAIQEVAKSQAIKSIEGGKVTDQDVQRMEFDNTLRGQLTRKLGLELGKEELLAEPAKFYKAFFSAIRDKEIENIRKEKARALGVIEASGDLPMDQVESAFRATTGEMFTSTEKSILKLRPDLKDSPEDLQKAVQQVMEARKKRGK